MKIPKEWRQFQCECGKWYWKHPRAGSIKCCYECRVASLGTHGPRKQQQEFARRPASMNPGQLEKRPDYAGAVRLYEELRRG